jgi:hypothetical protein
MPPQKPRLIDPTADAAGPSFAAAKMAIIIDEKMSADVMAIIFSFLPPKDIMRARLNRKWRDAAAKTMVPPSNFIVNTMAEYNAMKCTFEWKISCSLQLPAPSKIVHLELRRSKMGFGVVSRNARAQRIEIEMSLQ